MSHVSRRVIVFIRRYPAIKVMSFKLRLVIATLANGLVTEGFVAGGAKWFRGIFQATGRNQPASAAQRTRAAPIVRRYPTGFEPRS